MNLKRKYYFLLVLFINLITGCNTFNSSYLDSSFESDESLERTNSNYTKDYMYTSENSGYENGTSESSNIIDSYFSETHEIIRPASLDITNDAADAQESVGIYGQQQILLHELEFSDR